MDLMEWIAAGAIYNFDEFYDAPECHHQAHAVLDDITRWVMNIDESELARNDFILWLHGPPKQPSRSRCHLPLFP